MKLISMFGLIGALAGSIPPPAPAQTVNEPTTGAAFEAKRDGMSLLGVGLRIRKIVFYNAKVYAIGLYVADTALATPLTGHKGTPAFYTDLVQGDFPKQVVLKFVRTVGQSTIQEAMRGALVGADKARTDTFVSYFPEVKEGQECVLRWGAGGVLEVTMAGVQKPPIADQAFASAVFGIWLGDKPIQEDIKKALVGRAAELIK